PGIVSVGAGVGVGVGVGCTGGASSCVAGSCSSAGCCWHAAKVSDDDAARTTKNERFMVTSPGEGRVEYLRARLPRSLDRRRLRRSGLPTSGERQRQICTPSLGVSRNHVVAK